MKLCALLSAEDLEAGTFKKKIQTEPTLPIYLKVTTYSTHTGRVFLAFPLI
jgi:hypothetical protein